MMPLSEILFIGIVVYLLYRFVFNFLIPVFRTTKHVRQQFRNMQDTMRNQANMQGQENHQQQPFTRQNTQSRPGKPDTSRSGNAKGDYLDFEEIK
jgi:hypothetical protein